MPSYISSIGTALPRHKISQQRIAEFMTDHLAQTDEDRKKIALMYRASGIRSRYSVIPDFGLDTEELNFFPRSKGLNPFPTVSDRMALFEKEALPLAVKAVRDCFSKIDLPYTEVTHLITVTCTGLYAPGLDIQLVEKLPLNTTTQRTCINFMGCYAAFNALKMANAVVAENPKANVLIVALELCSIHMQLGVDTDSLLSGALFGDGAAALLVSGRPIASDGISLEMEAFHSDLALEAKGEMSWKIGDSGFLMTLNDQVPASIEKGIGSLTDRLMKKMDLQANAVDFYAIHPGGRKILEVIENALGLDKEKNEAAYEVLRQYGNMSSPTVLFVIKSILEKLTTEDAEKHLLSFAFGPGLTLEGMLLKVNAHA